MGGILENLPSIRRSMAAEASRSYRAGVPDITITAYCFLDKGNANLFIRTRLILTPLVP